MTDDEIRIRSATQADAGTIVEFQLRMALETETLALDRLTVTRGVQAVLDDPARGQYWLAGIGGEVAGGLLVVPEWSDWRNGTVWWIHSVYVPLQFRRRGVFRALYAHLKNLVEADPALKGLRLYVEKDNAAAQRTYEAMGMDGQHYRLYEWLK